MINDLSRPTPEAACVASVSNRVIARKSFLFFFLLSSQLSRRNREETLATPEANLWKYVGDVSISEFPTKNKGASIQSTSDIVSSLAWMILIELNAKKSEKCKELRACFFKETPQLSSLQSTRNSSLAQVSRFGYLGQSEME